MVVIREAKSKKEQKDFLNFPIELYRDCPNFVPPLYMDEKKIFNADYVYYDTSEAVYYNAYRDGKMVGRISGILQKASNEKTGEQRVRFTRFDAINDQEVATELFKAVEQWALSKGMDTICGPLGFSDLEREGLLIEGFEHLATYEEQYNYDYYQSLIENCGYQKEIDWVESKLRLPPDDGGKLKRATEQVMKKYNLHFTTEKNIGKFIKKYGEDFFRLLDEGYEDIYGTVPFSDNMKKLMISNFKLLLGTKYISIILDENNKGVCMGMCIPSIAHALQKSGGKLTLPCLIKILKAKKNPEYIDLALIAVDKRYVNKGVALCFLPELIRMVKESDNTKWIETNLNLETNHQIQNMWKRFDAQNHKRRRSFIKVLN
ncbi:MAG: hypothetical protein MJ092_03965 [Lachnospiraceae bacterium]|nr:hypothetical protein [Lachnospiraceae bacterium]